MRDFVAHVRRHLSRRDVAEDRYDEVVDELASELEARYTALVQRGSTDEDAWNDVLAQVPSWPALARDLAAAGTGSRKPSAPVTAAHGLRGRTLAAGARTGLRVLRKDRGFTATAIVTLAVCLGGHAAIVAGVNAMLFHPLRVPEPDRVLLMANQYPLVEARRGTRSATPDYERSAPARHGLRGAGALQLSRSHDRNGRHRDPHARHGGHAIALPPPSRQSGAWADLHRE